MRLVVKFYVYDLPPGFQDAEFTFDEDGATVNDVLDACLMLFKERGVTMVESELRTATVIVGGRWSNPGDRVSDGDSISIIRPMDGG